MNLDDTISKINSIDPVALEERLRIKPHSDKAIKKFDETCEKIAKNEPKIVLTINEAKNIYHDFASMYIIAKGTYPKDGMRKPFTLDILKMKLEKSEGK